MAFAFQYAAKFLCIANIPGTSATTTSLLPGSYQTSVNIHNPNRRAARFRMKLAHAPGGPVDTPLITKFLEGSLKPDEATRVDCGRVPDFGPPIGIHGFEGFLVIESTLSLDVIAVYTAGTGAKGGVASIDVERVFERKL